MATLLAASAALPAGAQDRPLPDLVATIYRLDLDNGVLQVDAAVRNQGTSTYGGGDDVVVQSSDGVKRYLKLPEIPEGQEYRFNLTIRGAGASVEVVVEADPRDKVTELFEGNNRAERRTSRPADLLVAGLRVESPPTDREPAHLLAELRDQLRSVTGVEPTAVQVRVRAALRAVGGQPVEFLVDEQVVPDFTGIHLMPVDVRLPADARTRLGGVRTADVEVEVCVNPDLLVAELGEQCAEGEGCNNCGTVTMSDVVLPEAPLTEAERRERARQEAAARAEAEAEPARLLVAQPEAPQAAPEPAVPEPAAERAKAEAAAAA
ncbi:hypothetical protein L6R53_32705, partial [Myxococcota bacterium]|nr:hypothetical protein [Myxococcota bacterium]